MFGITCIEFISYSNVGIVTWKSNYFPIFKSIFFPLLLKNANDNNYFLFSADFIRMHRQMKRNLFYIHHSIRCDFTHQFNEKTNFSGFSFVLL